MPCLPMSAPHHILKSQEWGGSTLSPGLTEVPEVALTMVSAFPPSDGLQEQNRREECAGRWEWGAFPPAFPPPLKAILSPHQGEESVFPPPGDKQSNCQGIVVS